MAMKKRYHTVNGMLIGETSNGVRRGYLPDALGSVVATVDSNGSIENTYRYKPYGSLLTKTGAGADPRFLWVGTSGSRFMATTYAEAYNRSRHFGCRSGCWGTVDRFWPAESPYAYSRGNPVTLTDPTGEQPQLPWPGFDGASCKGLPDIVKHETNDCMSKLCSRISDPWVAAQIIRCYGSNPHPQLLICIDKFCKSGTPIVCDDQCATSYQTECPCPDGTKITIPATEFGYNNCVRENDPGAQISLCLWWFTEYPKKCPGGNPLTRPHVVPGQPGSWALVVLHELVHLCGKCKVGPNHNDLINPISDCIAKVLGCPEKKK